MNIAKLIHLNTHPVQFGRSCQFTYKDDYFFPVRVVPVKTGSLYMFNTTIDPMPWYKPEIYLRTGASTIEEVIAAVHKLAECITPGMMLVDTNMSPIHVIQGRDGMFTVLYHGKMQRMPEYEIKNLLPPIDVRH